MAQDSTEPSYETFVTLLVPLATAMIERGVTAGLALEAMKNAMVRSALDHGGNGVSDSWVSLRTGLNRKEVKRLRGAPAQKPRKRKLGAATLALTRWSKDKDFCAPDGRPYDLPRQASAGQPGFDALIRAAKIDLPPATVLEALLDQRLVETLADGRIRMLSASVVARPQSQTAFDAFEKTVSAHLNAATTNLVAREGDPRFFDRAVHYSHLRPGSVDRIEQEAREGAQDLLESINALAYRYLQQDAGDAGANSSFTLGTYIYPLHSAERAPTDGDLP